MYLDGIKQLIELLLLQVETKVKIKTENEPL